MKQLLAIGVILIHMDYPEVCCGNHRDCRPVPCAELTPQPDGGYIWHSQGGRTLIFPRVQRQPQYGSAIWSIGPSRDGQCHVCVHSDRGGTVPLCVFVPQEVS